MFLEVGCLFALFWGFYMFYSGMHSISEENEIVTFTMMHSSSYVMRFAKLCGLQN